MKCPSCGIENRPAARFCMNCSEPLVAEQPEVGPLCQKCGSLLQPNTRFCGNCGAPIAMGETAPIGPKPAPSPAPQSAPTVKTPRPPSPPTQPTPARPSPPTVKAPRRPAWSTPPTVKTPPPPAAWPPPQSPPRRKRGMSGCVWALIVGGVLGGLVLIAAIALVIFWYATGGIPWLLH
ncbi:MAG: zinc ribbon domain-containing protein [Anaerolineae bacterium]|nr:zinc ribbon domain-containing protein [Anaerolineae bacterium]